MKWLLFLLAATAHAAIPVWIDTDPSVARGGREVDDGFALIQAFRSKALAIRGVSVVFGNAPLAEGLPIGRRLLSEFGPGGLAVHSGAASGAELGVETDATRALAAALRREKLVILMLGPATNVATVLRNHPELRSRIVQLVAVAGRRPQQRFAYQEGGKAFRDFNFELDAPAFQVLLDAKIPLVLTGWEISSKVWLREGDLAGLRAKKPALGWVLDAAGDWLSFWKSTLGTEGFNPFDALAIGYGIDPKGFRCERLPVRIEQLPDDTVDAGTQPLKPYLLVESNSASQQRALYCSEAPARFRAEFLALLAN